jgi:hypothetical protein
MLLFTAIKLLMREAQLAYLRGKQAMPSALRSLGLGIIARLVVEMRAARRLERLAVRLARMRGKISALAARLNDGSVTERIDADLSFREALIGLKEEIRAVRYQLALMEDASRQGHAVWPALQRAFDQLNKVAQETYSAADQLQWRIAEHDARFA